MNEVSVAVSGPDYFCWGEVFVYQILLVGFVAGVYIFDAVKIELCEYFSRSCPRGAIGKDIRAVLRICRYRGRVDEDPGRNVCRFAMAAVREDLATVFAHIPQRPPSGRAGGGGGVTGSG